MDKSREAFEQHMRGYGFVGCQFPIDKDGRYKNEYIYYAFEAWQAARADLEREVLELKEKLGNVYEEGIRGILYVAKANYAERENEALRRLNNAYYGDDND